MITKDVVVLEAACNFIQDSGWLDAAVKKVLADDVVGQYVSITKKQVEDLQQQLCVAERALAAQAGRINEKKISPAAEARADEILRRVGLKR